MKSSKDDSGSDYASLNNLLAEYREHIEQKKRKFSERMNQQYRKIEKKTKGSKNRKVIKAGVDELVNIIQSKEKINDYSLYPEIIKTKSELEDSLKKKEKSLRTRRIILGSACLIAAIGYLGYSYHSSYLKDSNPTKPADIISPFTENLTEDIDILPKGTNPVIPLPGSSLETLAGGSEGRTIEADYGIQAGVEVKPGATAKAEYLDDGQEGRLVGGNTSEGSTLPKDALPDSDGLSPKDIEIFKYNPKDSKNDTLYEIINNKYGWCNDRRIEIILSLNQGLDPMKLRSDTIINLPTREYMRELEKGKK